MIRHVPLSYGACAVDGAGVVRGFSPEVSGRADVVQGFSPAVSGRPRGLHYNRA